MLRCASIGLGWWAGMHATAIQGKSSLVRIEACHNESGDPAFDATAMQSFTERFGARAIARFDDVLADKTIDALIITTPHSRHVPQIIAAAGAGKHVLVEKPLALSVESGRSALEACRKAGVVLAVGHNRRFTSPLRAVKALVEGNALGTILHAEANFSYPGGLGFKKGYWRADPAEAPGGAMTATLIHMIDGFMHLLGPIDRVIGARSKHRATPLEIEDTTSMLVEFAGGPTGYIGGTASRRPMCRASISMARPPPSMPASTRSKSSFREATGRASPWPSRRRPIRCSWRSRPSRAPARAGRPFRSRRKRRFATSR